MNSTSDKVAYLSNAGGFTEFRYNNRCVRFAAPYSLEYYTGINEWDDGYLVVMAKYAHNDAPEEDYIDLTPILEDLYIDAEEFLEPIQEVRVLYD